MTTELATQRADKKRLHPTRTLELEGGGRILLFERWLESDAQLSLFGAINNEISWRQESIRLFGKSIPQPRLTAAFADPGVSYKYSGLVVEPKPWTTPLTALKDRVELTTGHRFNHVLANLYRTGADSMGFHADDEPELGQDPAIGSVSLGSPRRFVLRHAQRKELKVDLLLGGGSLLVMEGTLQHHWQHAVPKATGEVGARINLTFRQVKAPLPKQPSCPGT